MDEVFFITGGGSGIGRVTARFLLTRGYKVFLTDADPAFLEETCTSHLPSVLPKKRIQNFQWQKMDVTQDTEVEAAVKRCMSSFGRLDVLMNRVIDAGINSQYFRQGIRMENVPVSDFEKVLSVNLVGTFRVSQHCIPHLELSPGGGVIINISSCRATQQSPHGEAYAASKAGINGLTMAMAQSLGPKIRVHSVSPGMVDVHSERERQLVPDEKTLMYDLDAEFKTQWAPEWGSSISEAVKAAHPVGRIGRGEDIARWIEFLGVLEGGFTTGGEYVVDGGYSKVLAYPNQTTKRREKI